MDPTAPLYVSWGDYLARTTPQERRAWCQRKAKRSNRPRLMSNAAEKLSVQDVVDVFEAAQGRCRYCGSLAVEGRPSTANGGPAPWEHIGRRIGSLDHPVSLVLGGRNHITNLAWSCLWCNTWPSLRLLGATDHGAVR
ncbi:MULTISPECIES: HNH endonuclease [Amycolatopsis]|uniref:HNH endonuclease signature motif containing protein n=1 Tax=Amycolatopsis albidoflavus TaxID=102226 RepID=A0ABW5I4L3_9PSEU